MQRPSTQETDGITWATAALPLGTIGLDLRQPADPGSLAKLQNARFRDARTVERRTGHVGVQVQDGSDFPASPTPSDWMYGVGQYVGSYHFPIAGRGGGVFRFDGSDVVWTGDRLLVMREDETGLGASVHWNRFGTTTRNEGLPAFLPVQTESTPPDVISGDYVETCLTETTRVIVATAEGTDLVAWVVDRATGAVINKSTIVNDTASVIYEPRVFVSGQPTLLYRQGTELFMTWWSGVEWATPSRISGSANAHCVATIDGGFMVAWREGTDVLVGRYVGHNAVNTPFAFGTTLSGLTSSATTSVALAIAPDETFSIIYTGAGIAMRQYTAAAVFDAAFTLYTPTVLVTDAWSSGLTACYRARTNASGRYPIVVYAGSDAETMLIEHSYDGIGTTQVVTNRRYRSQVHSHAFRVGDEVFCWLRALNSETAYLMAGTRTVCGIADREVAKERVVVNNSRVIPMVQADPLDEHVVTWARPFTTTRIVDDTAYAELYNRAGNVLIGDINFLPALSAVQYGESVYVAGSLVRCYDGIELGDAGFHDYPTVESLTAGTSGSLSTGSAYQFRVYPVRYNKRGERFQGSAITSATLTLAGYENSISLVINALPLTNHDDVEFEVYRSEAGGTTFYLDGTVTNDLSAATVSYTSTVSDATLRTRAGDPHAPGVGSLAEVEEMGPYGCEFLAATADRLWGWGGQVPRGWLQFSKLKEANEGAGFDVLAGAQQVDAEGGAITSFVGYNDALVVFEEERVYVMFGTGPDNYGTGAYSTPQITLADGATSHFGTVISPAGVLYWGSDGPRLLTAAFKTEPVSTPVRALASTMTPTGVRLDTGRQEIVWYTADGNALLWNYLSGSRWAQWTGLFVAGCSEQALITTSGVLLTPDDVYHDNGTPYAFVISSSNLRPEEILQGHTHVRRAGITGEHFGDHEVRFRVFYDNSPLWSEEFVWEPQTETWLTSGTELATLTPAQVDALTWRDHAGSYETDKRLKRQTCNFFRVEITDISSDNATFTPYELVFELGRKPGLGRTVINTFRG